MRRTALTWAAVAGLGIVGGCKDEPAEETDVACETFDASGGTITSSDEILSLAFRPATFAEPTQVCIRPAPAEADFLSAWPAYRVTPDLALPVTAAIGFRHPSVATQEVSIVKVRVEDYRLNQAQWIPLPTGWVDRSNAVIATHDGDLAMFYGLLASGPLGTPGEGGGDSTTGTTGTTGGTTVVPVGTTGEEIRTTDEGGIGTSEDPSSSADSGPGDGSSEGAADGAAETGDTDPGEDIDCADLPQPPFAVSMVETPDLGPNNEDLAMTGDGAFVIMAGTDLATFDEAGDRITTLHTGITDQVLGLAVDPAGNPVFALGFSQAEPRTIDTIRDGVRSSYATGFGLANGLFFATDGTLWATDFAGGEIVRVTSDHAVEPVLSGTGVQSPNGIFYDERRDRLYWSTYGNAQLWSATIDAAGNPGTPERIAAADIVAQPTARWDGVTMDACGHLYVVDQNQGNDCQVHRIELDDAGLAVSDVVLPLTDDGALGPGCTGLEFGYGFGTDADRSLFVTNPEDGRVRRIAVGVSGHPLR